MNRGDVYFIDFDPAVGEEIRKTRPAVIVSNDSINAKLQRVQVVPITSNNQRLYSNEASVLVAGKQGKALASQLTTVSKQRIGKKLDVLSTTEMAAIDKAILWQLDL